MAADPDGRDAWGDRGDDAYGQRGGEEDPRSAGRSRRAGQQSWDAQQGWDPWGSPSGPAGYRQPPGHGQSSAYGQSSTHGQSTEPGPAAYRQGSGNVYGSTRAGGQYPPAGYRRRADPEQSQGAYGPESYRSPGYGADEDGRTGTYRSPRTSGGRYGYDSPPPASGPTYGGAPRSPFGDPRDRPYGTAPLPPPRPPARPARSRDEDEIEPSWRARVRPGRKNMPLWQELPLLLIVAFCLAVLIRTFLLQAFFIPSGSMEDTLLVGDRVLVNKIVYDVREPQRGEVVVFRGTDNWAPENLTEPSSGFFGRLGRTVGDLVGVSQPGEKDFIKRVIGLPGDEVSCCDAQGRVQVNGYGLDEETYVIRNSPLDVAPSPRECRSRRFGPIDVEPGNMFVMGDHRAVSQDSRCQGQVPIENVIGRAFVIVWPSNRWAGMPVPDTFANVPDRKATASGPMGPRIAPDAPGSSIRPGGAVPAGSVTVEGPPKVIRRDQPDPTTTTAAAAVSGTAAFLGPFVAYLAVPARSRRRGRPGDVSFTRD